MGIIEQAVNDAQDMLDICRRKENRAGIRGWDESSCCAISIGLMSMGCMLWLSLGRVVTFD